MCIRDSARTVTFRGNEARGTQGTSACEHDAAGDLFGGLVAQELAHEFDAEFEGGSGASAAVSYTHLDVYKRQGLDHDDDDLDGGEGLEHIEQNLSLIHI